MGINIGSDEISSLVEKDRVHKRVYTDPAIFELEMQRIWGTAWVFIGHESQVPEPGDYYATTLGKQAVIMTRHHDGEVKVLFVKVCVPASVATVESIAIVPEDVIAPPDKPVPAVIEVTVPTFCGVIVV